MPMPISAGERPTTKVKKTALAVMKAPSPTAKSTDWTDSLPASGVGGLNWARTAGRVGTGG